MYRISEEKLVSLDSSDGVATVEALIIASSPQELPAYNGITGRILVPGSCAIVPSESLLFVMDFDHEWKEWGETE